MNIFPKDVKTMPVFKNYEEFRKFSDEFYEEIRPEIEELHRRRDRSVMRAMGLNPDSLKY